MKPDSLIKSALMLAGLFALVELGLLLDYSRHLVNECRKSQEKIASSTLILVSNANETMLFARKVALNINVMVARAKVATHSMDEAAKSQAAYWKAIESKSLATMDSVNTLAGSLDALVRNTDRSINSDLLPRTAEAIDQTADTLKTLNAAIVDASTGANVALADIHTLLADPAITDSLKAIHESSENVAGLTSSAEKSAGYIEGYLSPKKMTFWARLIQFFIPKLSIDLK